MAIQEQIEILRLGVDAWNKWRARHVDRAIDLGKANLVGADLFRADLNEADLSQANLSKADLSRATLIRANLVGADLFRADLNEANLVGADLSKADLIGANLSEANLVGADLSGANLSRANLFRVNLSRANLREVNLGRASLSGSHIRNATVVYTHFADLDLRTVKGLETTQHIGPSYIDTSTLQRSQGDIPEAFLRGAGLSDTFIEYARSLVARPIEYYTCFLSYSSRDQDIAERLYANLQSKGVRCWYAPHELKPGDYYRHKIDESIRVYDKLVLILSSHSVESEWVEKEVDIALKKEESMNMTRHVLFPIRLDNAALQSRRAWVRSLRFHRHIGDFTGWKDHDTYQAAFERLLSDLKAELVKKSE